MAGRPNTQQPQEVTSRQDRSKGTMVVQGSDPLVREQPEKAVGGEHQAEEKGM